MILEGKYFRRTVLFLTLLALFLIFTHSVTAKSAEIPEKFCRYYEGTVGVGHKIKMKLEKQEDMLTGHYYYVEYKQDIFINGEVKEENEFYLKEYDQNTGKYTGRFRGKFFNDTMKGLWSNSTGCKKFPFELHEVGLPLDVLKEADKY
jgi:hypothetical protein